jgi:hypothetical protein
MDAEVLRFRQRAIETRGDRKRASYPIELREGAVRYLVRCRAEGRSLRQAAEDLGVDSSTLYFWTRPKVKKKASTKMMRVVVAEPEQHAKSAFIVFGPCGLRVEGATVADIAALVRALT